MREPGKRIAETANADRNSAISASTLAMRGTAICLAEAEQALISYKVTTARRTRRSCLDLDQPSSIKSMIMIKSKT